MEYQLRHARELADVLSPEWQAFSRQQRNVGGAVVVLDSDEPVAIGAMYHNLVHPNPWWFHFRLRDNAPADCLTPLLDTFRKHLASNGNGDAPIHISIGDNKPDVIAWAEGQGFETIRTTHLGRLYPPAPRWEPLPQLPRLADHDSPGIRRDLAGLHQQIYRRNHAWNPMAPLTPEMAEAMFLDDSELIPEFQWFARDDAGRMIGCSSLRKTQDANVLDFGWIGVLPGVPESVHKMLFAVAISAVGSRELIVEVDDNDALTYQFFAELPVLWLADLLRLELKP